MAVQEIRSERRSEPSKASESERKDEILDSVQDYPAWAEPLPDIPNFDRNTDQEWPEVPKFDKNIVENQLLISESNRNHLESPMLMLYDVCFSSELPPKKRGEDPDPLLSTLASRNNKLPRTGSGLANLGNTCYLNAILQCFMHTVPFVREILSDTHSVQCNSNKEGFCLLCALHKLCKLSLTSEIRTASPLAIVNNLSYFSPTLRRSQQEDAHEFLQFLLDKLDSCYQSVGSPNIVKQVFGGCLRSKVKCCKCGHYSETLEKSVGLSLGIDDANDLITALQSFTKVEKMEDPEVNYTCEGCKDKVFIEKQLCFEQVPSVATFHLKRFKVDGVSVQKIDKHVAFPLELDLLPFTVIGKMIDMELKYVLHAVVVHVGVAFSSGHYYCFIRLAPNMWCKFDDATVVRVSEDHVLSQRAYILFYAKEDTDWFSSFIETQKLCQQSTLPNSLLDINTFSSPPNLLKLFSGVTAPGLNKLESNESKDNLQKKSVSGSPLANGSKSEVSSHEPQEKVPLDMLYEVGKGLFQTHISPSTEINRGGLPGGTGPISRDDKPLFDHIPCKRQLEKDFNGMGTKEACSSGKISIYDSKGEQVLAEDKRYQSEGSVSRKKSRFAPPVSKDDSSVLIDQSSLIAPVLHPWIARTFRYS